jgi:hypothetical protein
MKLDVVSPKENFKGMSYSDWISIWANWLWSADPDNYDGGDMLFLRGNIDYGPVGGIVGAPRFIDSKSIYDRTGEKGETINEKTGILIPILTSHLNCGGIFDGKKICTREKLRFCINKDIDRMYTVWANILNNGNKKPTRIVKNIREFKVQSQVFKFSIPTDSLLNAKSEMPDEVGEYESIVGGYFLILRSLPRTSYRIMFGGRGPGTYYTNAIYDIRVDGRKKERLVDLSGHNSPVTFKV